MIEIKGLTKRYQTKETDFLVLKNINLRVDAGESVAIMGKSGAGKSTLLNIIGCLDRFEEGSYHLAGKDIAALNDQKLSKIRNENIGFVMQDFSLVSNQTVLFNTMLPMMFDKTPRREMKRIALQALGQVGLQSFAKNRVNPLSGGEKQRVAIARAIVKKPLLILADEPTGALDSKTGRDILEMLMGLNREGMTIVLVTHDEEIAVYCRRKIVISDGEMISDEINQKNLTETMECIGEAGSE